MSSLVGAHGMAFATAMAVSGTVILLALCRPRPLTDASTQNPKSKKLGLRPCINSSSSGDGSQMKKKRVRFAEDVVVEFEAEGSSDDEFDYDYSYGYDYDYDYDYNYNYGEEEEYGVTREQEEEEEEEIVERMPANRVALYNGILQARMHRIACSY